MRNTHLMQDMLLEDMYKLEYYDSSENDNSDQIDQMKKYIAEVMEIALTDRQREIVKMYHGYGKRTPEIAVLLGISPRLTQITLKKAMLILMDYKKVFFK